MKKIRLTKHSYDFLRMLMFSAILICAFVSTGCKESGLDSLLEVAEEVAKDESNVGNSALEFTPKTYDFGNLAPFPNFKEKIITVKNISSELLEMGTVEGANSNFSITGNQCLERLKPKEECEIKIKYSPVSGGSHTMAMIVNYGDFKGNKAPAFNATMTVIGSSNADAPSNYKLEHVTGTTMKVSWVDNASNETGYEVQRCDGSTCDSTFVAANSETIAKDSTEHTLTGLTEGNLYRVRIRALSSGANSDFLNGTLAMTFGGVTSTDNGAFNSSFVSQLDCSTHTGVYLGLNWNSVSNASFYRIYDTTSGTATLLSTVSTNSHIIKNLTGNTAKKYRVTAVTSGGLESLNTQADLSLTTSSVPPCWVYPHTGLTKFDQLRKTLNSPYSVWSDGTSKVIVADRNNHRVLIWNSIPSTNMAEPDVVLGQPDFEQTILNNGGRSAKSLNYPEGVWSDGTKLYVADRDNHRVLIWNTIPTANHTAADVVVGQPSFTSASGARDQDSFNRPSVVHVAGGKLFVADSNNNRVAVFNSIPTTNGAAMDVVVGQTSFTANSGTCNQKTLDNPRGIWSDGTRLIVVSYDDNRALFWSTIPTTNGTNATNVIGQTNFTGCSKNRTNSNTPNDVGLRTPWGVTSDGTNVWISDYYNNRVMYYSNYIGSPSNGPSADGVYGPPNMNSTSGGSQNNRFNRPMAIVRTPNNHFWVSENSNHRVIQKTSLPTAAVGDTHDLVLGQEGFGVSGANRVPTSNKELHNPGQMATDGTRLAIADTSRHRVLIWNTMPTTNSQVPDVVLGQPDFTTATRDNGASGSGKRLDEPYGVAFHGGKFYVADSRNNRILVWNTIPTTNHAAADFVIGQTALNQYNHSNAATRLRYPTGLHFSSDNKLIVADRDNNRVVIFNTIPTANGASASVVVGQTAFGNSGAAKTQNRLDAPWMAYTMPNGGGSALIVSERDNNRAMIWNSIPTSNGENANVVLGQPNFTTNTADNGGVSNVSMDQPFGITHNNGKLYIAEYDNNRILVWNSLPTTNRQPADAVLGQANFTGSAINGNVSRSHNRIGQPRHLMFHGGRLFVSETANQRLMSIVQP